MNKKAQVESLIYFFGIILAVIVVAVVMGYFVNTLIGKFSNSIASVSTQANETGQSIISKFNNVWDSAIIAIFILNILILLVSSFLIDVHPLFVILYIIAFLILIFLAPNMLYASEQIISNSTFSSQYARMPMTNFLFDNFIIVLIGVFILSGVIMYAKFKMNSGGIGGNY